MQTDSTKPESPIQLRIETLQYCAYLIDELLATSLDLEIYDQCRIHGQPYPAIAARYGITSARVFAICSDVDSFIFKVRQDRFTQERTQEKVHAAVAD